MKTTIFTLAMVFIFTVQSLYAQDAHEKFETIFSNLSINQVVETLKIKKKYALDPLVQTTVDSSYQSFHNEMYSLIENDPLLTYTEINERITIFLGELNILIATLPKGNETELNPVKMMDGPCVNMDFEAGDLSGWDLEIGEADGSTIYSYVNGVPAGPGPNHQIYGGGLDPVVGISRVNPDGGSFSVRLGNGTTTGAGAARMSQTFLVDATNYFYTYSYAVVFQNPNGHSAEERPYFTVRVYDEFGGNIDCGEYSVYADPANASDYESIGDVLYKDWTTVFTNLSAFIGQNVTIEFTTGDCSLGGHYGYAYLDASCALQEITATDYTICPDETSTLTAPAGIGSYLWSTGETTQSIMVSNGGVYSCLMTPLQGPACSVTLDITIVEFPEPTADFSITNAVSCLGTPVEFNDNSSITGPGIISTYQWNFGNGVNTPASNGPIVAVPNTTGTYANPEHDYAAAGNYNVTLTIVSSDGCADELTLPVTINPTPVVVAGLDQTVCFGEQVTLNGAGANTYSWDNGITDGIAFTPTLGTTTFTVTGTNLSGCENTDQVNITVNPLPIVNAGSDQTICFGNQVTLSGAGANTYSWDNGIIDGLAFSPAVGMINYTVTGTDLNGCEDNDVVSVLVHALPIVNAGLDQAVCDNILVTLSGSGANNYTWNNGVNNGISFQAPIGNTLYTLTGTDINGCENTDQVQVTVYNLPVVNAGLDQTVCENDQVILIGNGAIIYDWNNGIINGVAFVQNVGQQTYTLIGTDINGCEDTDQVVVSVNPNPIVNAGNDITICEGESVILTGSGATNYVWSNGAINGVAFFPAQGNYTYHLIGSLVTGCHAADSLILTVHPKPMVWAADVNVCRGSEAVLKAHGADAYLWSHGITDNVPFTPALSETYVVTGWNIFGCSDTAIAKVIVHEIPEASFYPTDYEITVLNPSTTFINTSVGASSYIWTFGDGSVESDEVSPFHEFPAENPGVYEIQLIASNPFGCIDTAVRYIVIKDELIIYVPNTFTPDGDGHNNSFKPVLTDGFDPQAYTLYIFNRWGQIVFESHDTDFGWNGFYGLGSDKAQDGTYTWKIEVKEEYTPKMHVFAGHVNLIR
jgi:gliding motility-associated-like protein